MRPAKSNWGLSIIYIDFAVKNNDKDPEFKDSNHVRISKYKNILTKGYILNCSYKVFVTKEVKYAIPLRTYLIEDLNGEIIIGTFYEKELQKTNQTEFKIQKGNRKKIIYYMWSVWWMDR